MNENIPTPEEKRKGLSIIILIAIACFLTWIVYDTFGVTDKASKTTEPPAKVYYLDKQTEGVKACVKTLGQGVYKYEPLQWKLKNCNAKY